MRSSAAKHTPRSPSHPIRCSISKGSILRKIPDSGHDFAAIAHNRIGKIDACGPSANSSLLVFS